MAAVAEVPFEIWKEVAGYLPHGSLRHLYTVNRAFFQLALDEKYRKICFNNPVDLFKGLRYLSLPLVSKRVQSLAVSPAIFNYDDLRPRRKFYPFAMPRMRLRKEASRQWTSTLNTMANLVNVTSLEITHRHQSSDFGYFLPVLAAGMSSFGNNLLKLTLVVNITVFHHSIFSTMILPRLEHLELTLSLRAHDLTPTVSKSSICDLAASFVNNHHPTLTTLVFRNSHIPEFLLKLRNFPYLTKLVILYTFNIFQDLSGTGLNHMFAMHKAHLRELSLDLRGPTPSSWFSAAESHIQECFTVRLEQLHVLHFWLDMFRDTHRISQYLSLFNNTLTTLVLTGHLLSHEEVGDIMSAFSGNTSLRHLTMPANGLCPQLLELLATRLPNLDTLRLRPTFSPDHPEPHVNNVILFRKSVWAYNYAGWKLRYLEAHLQFISLSDLEKCEAALRNALPMVKTVTLTAGVII